MTTEPAQHLPVLRFYREFPDEWDSLPPATREALGDFLEQLQRNPLNPELIGSTEQAGEYFAHALPDGHSVVWRLEFLPSPLLQISTSPERIWILAVVSPAKGRGKDQKKEA